MEIPEKSITNLETAQTSDSVKTAPFATLDEAFRPQWISYPPFLPHGQQCAFISRTLAKLQKNGAPEGSRTPNLQIRSLRFDLAAAVIAFPELAVANGNPSFCFR